MASEKEKELDIFDIIKETFQWLGNLLKKIGLSILYFIRFTYRNGKVIVAFLALGIIAAAVFSLPFLKTYKTDVVFKLNDIDSYMAFDLIEDLNNNLKEQRVLPEILNLADSSLKSIASIKPHFIIDLGANGTPDLIDIKDNFLETKKNVRMDDRLYIQIKTKNLNSLPQIQNGLMYYFSNNEILKKRNQLRSVQLKNSYEFLTREALKIDSLSSLDYFKNQKQLSIKIDSQSVTFGEPQKQLYYKDMKDILKNKDEVEAGIVIDTEVVSVIKPLGLATKQSGIVERLEIFCPIFLLLGYAVAVFRQFRKPIRKFLKS